jgi:hypothetical protein
VHRHTVAVVETTVEQAAGERPEGQHLVNAAEEIAAERIPSIVVARQDQHRDVLIRIGIHAPRYASADEFIQHTAANRAAPFGLSDEQRQAFIEDVVSAPRGYEDDLGLTFPMTTHLVTARA